MGPDSSLSIGSRIQKGTLNEEEAFADSLHSTALVRVGRLVRFFEFVHDHAVLVHRWRQDEILSLCLDLHITEALQLCETLRKSDSEYRLPCELARQIMVKLIREFETVRPWIELWVVVQVAIRVSRNVRKCLQVLVCPLAVAECEKIEGDLTVCKLDSRVLEECIRGIEKVKALATRLLTLLCWLTLQLGVSQHHLRDLEENHFATDCLYDAVCRLQGCNKARLYLLCLNKVLRHIVEQVDHKVVAVSEIHKQVLRLRQEEIFWIRHHHHLWLLECRFQVVELNVVVIRDEGNLNSLARLTRQQLLLEHTLDSGTCISEITALHSWLRNVECENVRWWHWWPVHVLLIGDEIDGTAVELWALLMISSVSIGFDRRVVVVLSSIDVAAEGAHPLLSVLKPSNEWIDIRSAILTTHDRFGLEVYMRYLRHFSVLALKNKDFNFKKEKTIVLLYLLLADLHTA